MKVNNIMENKNYAKLLDNNQLEYAPRVFKTETGVIIPKLIDDNFFFNRGYYKVIDNVPYYNEKTDSLKIYRIDKDDDKHTLTIIYEVVSNNQQQLGDQNKVKKFSKLKLTLFCIEHNIWQDVKEYLEKIGYYDLFVMAQYFLETDEYFVKGLESFKQAYIDENRSEQDIDMLIENMKNFAHDGYIINEK